MPFECSPRFSKVPSCFPDDVKTVDLPFFLPPPPALVLRIQYLVSSFVRLGRSYYLISGLFPTGPANSIARMSCICIGPICIPYQAFIPFFYYLWFPLWKWLKRTFPSLDKKNGDGGAAGQKIVRSQDDGECTNSTDGALRKRGTGKVIEMNDDSDWSEVEKQGENEGKAIVIDFTATWCGPCQKIAPKFKEFASVYRNAIFVKCDVDDCDETAAKFRVKCMPTFKIIKNGKQLGEVQGADPAALEAAIKKHCA